MHERHTRSGRAGLVSSVDRSAAGLISLAASLLFLGAPILLQGQSPASTTWYVTIVLPPRIVAGSPATLAVFGADGRLAPNVTVELSNIPSVKTDATGRAFFNAPAQPGVMFATASGVSAVVLVDSSAAFGTASGDNGFTIAPVISLKDRFSICGNGFRGDADANHVTMNGDRALVVASSPECLVLLPSPRATPGPAKLSIDSPAAQRSITTTLVSLQFEAPVPAPLPGKKSQLTVHVEGSDSPLAISITNETPGVLEFLHGDTQELRTSGGSRNIAQVEVGAIRSGDFSFNAKLLPPSDIPAAGRYLRAAVPLAPKGLQRRVKTSADRLASHPRDSEKVRLEISKMISVTIAGNFRTLLEAARSAL
jgi:hypothetical protein